MAQAPPPTRVDSGNGARPEGRVPPQDLGAEASVLGAILLDQEVVGRVLDILSPEDFYRENNGQIYKAALTLFREGEPIDQITLGARLEKMGVLERVGGHSTLAQLREQTPTAGNAEHYARIVKDRACRRRLVSAGSDVVALAFEDSLNADEAVNRAQARVHAVADERPGHGLVRVSDGATEDLTGRYFARKERGGRVGLSTGFDDIDRYTDGFKPGEMTIVAATTGTGKTALMLNMVYSVLQQGCPVALFSLEMSQEMLLDRMASMIARVDGKRLQRGLLSESEEARFMQAVAHIHELPLYIDESSRLNVMEAFARTRQAHARNPFGLVVVDYIQLMEGLPSEERKIASNRSEVVDGIVRGTRDIARTLKVPALVLAQFNRKAQERPVEAPRLVNLRESGALEQTADVALILHRPDLHKPDLKPGLCEVHVAKNRNGPMTAQNGPVDLLFEKEVQVFKPVSAIRHNNPYEF